MRTIKETVLFKKDFKKYYKNEKIKEVMGGIVADIANGMPLDKKYRNHPLKGKWKNCYDCHILPDLILVYQVNNEYLKLVRMGTHSELFKK
jgi:mRNA interferase YafQ